MKIAILGTRGIPGRYGGFETFAEELSTRLVGSGHQVTVYCRTQAKHPRPKRHRGVRLVHLPAIQHKYAETLSHTLLSVLHAVTRPFDIVYVCNSANAPLCFVPWVAGKRTVLNVDGLEWERAKWGRIARAYYRWAARLAARMPIEVVTDARVIQDYYRRELKRETRFFPYGAETFARGHGANALAAMDLEADRYLLYVSRMERENNALLVVQAYAQLETDLPLVMVGDAPYAKEYLGEVMRAADPRVRFLGYRFGDEYHALQANARVYIQATEVGGTHPALVEALGHGNAVVAHDVPEHREVVGDAGRYFAYRDAADLARELRALLGDADAIAGLRARAYARIAEHYEWKAVAAAYESYFADLLSGGRDR